MGDNTIHYLGHVRMMGAVQPFISGAISKTVNLPEDVTVEDVEQLHIDAWQLGIKAVAIYRDNCKVAQPLSTTKKDGAEDPARRLRPGPRPRPTPGADREGRRARGGPGPRADPHAETVVVGAVRERLPRRRKSSTPSPSGWPTARAT